MDDQIKTFGQATSLALTGVQASQEQSTKGSSFSNDERQRKLAFLETFRRWEILFRRRDGDVSADRWLIAEYFRALGHLPKDGLNTLTDMLIRQCTFFPSIAECLKVMECDRYDYAHPFHSITYACDQSNPNQIGTAAWRRAAIGHDRQEQITANRGQDDD